MKDGEIWTVTRTNGYIRSVDTFCQATNRPLREFLYGFFICKKRGTHVKRVILNGYGLVPVNP